jgi:hypothetical protein
LKLSAKLQREIQILLYNNENSAQVQLEVYNSNITVQVLRFLLKEIEENNQLFIAEES